MNKDLCECDVLIIGSGGAGCRAAIEVDKEDLDCVIVSKGLSFRSGCTGMAEGGFNAAFAFVDGNDSVDYHYGDTLKGGAYLNDIFLVDVLTEEATDRIIDLEDYGALFDRQNSGLINQRAFGGQTYRRTCFQGDRTGHEMMMALKEEVIKRDIKTIDEVMITKLLLDSTGENVVGAVGLSLQDSHIIVFKAKSVILATGGAGQLFNTSSNTVQKSGDGYVLAYNAGADILDMEQVQFHPTGMVFPDSRKGVLVTEAVRGEGGFLKDKTGRRFMGDYDERMELATRDVVARAIYNEIREGRGTDNGGVYLDVTHLDPMLIEEKLETMLQQFLDVGVDIREEPMEVAPTAHHFMGGVMINPDCETNLGNLYAAGEVTGGVHGANRLGGNSLADTQVFGRRAGISASENAKKEDNTVFDEKQITDEVERISNLIHTGTVKPSSIKHQIQDIMSENVAIIRSEKSLRYGLSKLDELEKQLPDMKVPVLDKYNNDLVNAIEVYDMILLAKLIIKSAWTRKESRGAHYREDYPETSDDWKKSIILNKNQDLRYTAR